MKTNSQLQKDVLEQLKWDPSVTDGGIGVSVREGVVTLAGYVPSYAEKIGAEKATRKVAGVVGIVDDIQVKIPGSLGKITDHEIAKAAQDTLKWNVWVPHENVTVVVDDGWITLAGTLDWAFQRTAVERALRHLTGVVGITNGINLKARVQEKDIKAKIEQALQRSARKDAEQIKVSTVDGAVNLSGTVHTMLERADAEYAAWSATGVTTVKNEIRVQ